MNIKFQFKRSSKDAKFRQCLYLGTPLCCEQNHAVCRNDWTSPINFIYK